VDREGGVLEGLEWSGEGAGWVGEMSVRLERKGRGLAPFLVWEKKLVGARSTTKTKKKGNSLENC
jgi:hypothetical protein